MQTMDITMYLWLNLAVSIIGLIIVGLIVYYTTKEKYHEHKQTV